MNTESSKSDNEMIEETVQFYIDGAKSGKGEDMKPAFHKDADDIRLYRSRPVRWPHPAALCLE